MNGAIVPASKGKILRYWQEVFECKISLKLEKTQLHPLKIYFPIQIHSVFTSSAPWSIALVTDRYIEQFVPALSLNFFNVSASFICAWICAFNSCIFFKFSTICRLDRRRGSKEERHETKNLLIPDYFNDCWCKGQTKHDVNRANHHVNCPICKKVPDSL